MFASALVAASCQHAEINNQYCGSLGAQGLAVRNSKDLSRMVVRGGKEVASPLQVWGLDWWQIDCKLQIVSTFHDVCCILSAMQICWTSLSTSLHGAWSTIS